MLLSLLYQIVWWVMDDGPESHHEDAKSIVVQMCSILQIVLFVVKLLVGTLFWRLSLNKDRLDAYI